MKAVLIYLLLCCCLLPYAGAQGSSELYTLSNKADTAQIAGIIKAAASLEELMPDSSISLLTYTLQQSRNAGYEMGIASSLIHLGMAHMAKGATNDALANYIEATPYVQRCSYDKELLSRLYTGMGTPYLRKGDFSKASFYYYKALKEINSAGLQDSAVGCRLYLNLCNLWWGLRRFDYALNYVKQSEKVALKRKDTLALVFVYGNMGNLFYSRHETKKSDAYMLLALGMAEKKHILKAQQMLLANIGTSLRQEHKAAESIPYFEKALSLVDDEHAYQHNLQSYYNLACAYYETKDYKKAKQYSMYYLDKSEKLGMDREHIGDIMQVLAGVYENEKNYKESNIWLNKYLDYLTNSIEKQADSSINKLEDNYRISEKDKQIAQKQLLLSKKEIELKNKNIWIGGIAGCILLLGMLLFIVLRISRHRQHVQGMQIKNLKQEKELGYLKAMIEGEEKERGRLARELHDGIGGMLVSAKMSLGSIKENNTAVAGISELDEVIRLLNDTASEVRQTAHNLMPDALIRNSLKDALLLYCADINTGGQLDIDIQFHGQLDEMNKSAELILYRITQELIQNIIKHAKATQAVLQIIQDNGRLNLIAEDNGVGFDQEEINKGFGLQNLQFRVQALQGYISITSAKGKGTSVYIEFDLEKLKNV